MNTIKHIMLIILLIMPMLLLAGYSDSIKSQNAALKNENEQLRQQLDIANEKIKIQDEIYDLRNLLDYHTHEVLLKLGMGFSKEDDSYLNSILTDSITVSGNRVLSKDEAKNWSAELEIPETKFNLRQRAFMLSEDKKEFSSIYWILPIDESTMGERLEALYVYFVLDDGEWKLNYINIDH